MKKMKWEWKKWKERKIVRLKEWKRWSGDGKTKGIKGSVKEWKKWSGMKKMKWKRKKTKWEWKKVKGTKGK